MAGAVEGMIAMQCQTFPACEGRAQTPSHRRLRYLGEFGKPVVFSRERLLGREQIRLKTWEVLMQTAGGSNGDPPQGGWKHGKFNITPTMLRQIERLEPRLTYFGYSLLTPRQQMYTADDPRSDVFAPWGLGASRAVPPAATIW